MIFGGGERRVALALLGLPGGAARAEITRAYHRLARATHPDVCPEPDAAQRFAQLNRAYRTAFAAAPAHNVTRPADPPPTVSPPAVDVPAASGDLRVGPVHYTPWPTGWRIHPRRVDAMELNRHRPLYGISVAADLTGANPQMLRAYEARGLIGPHRTPGGTRRYSNHDLQLVGRITALLADGLNLAGIEQVLLLEAENRRLQHQRDALQAQRAPRGRPGRAPAGAR